MRTAAFVLFLLHVLCVSAPAAQELTSNDFAYGFLLEARENGAVYSLPVPNEVYRTARRADLGDIRVFNSAGEAVPHGLRTLETPAEKTQDAHAVPYFPLFEKDAAAGDNMSLSVRRNEDGTIIAIDSNQARLQTAEQPSGFLLDLGEKRGDVGSLEFSWQADRAHGSAAVTVQQSPDLQRWWTLVDKATLVDLQYAGNRVEQRKIELPYASERYLKITWLQPQTPLALTGVTALSRPLVSRQNMQWVSLYNGAKSTINDNLAIDFTSEYRLPVRSVRLQFPEMNSMVSAVVQSRADQKGSWREQCRGVFYLLEVGGERLQSEPCSFAPSNDRLWRLLVTDDGAGLTGNSRTVTLDLGWQSDELLFLARGTGPFILAYGSGKLENGPTATRSDMVLTAVHQQQGSQFVQTATLGRNLELGGQRALVPPPPPKPWKTWLLWTVLIAGVIGMAAMAMSLMKDLRKKDEGGGEEA